MGSVGLAPFARRLEVAKGDLDRLVPERRYYEVCQLVMGIDCGLGSSVTGSFQKWIIARDAPSRPELGWPFIAAGWNCGHSRELYQMTAEQNHRSVEVLFERFDEFFNNCPKDKQSAGDQDSTSQLRSIESFIPHLQRLHGMYVLRQTFGGTCAFLQGFELGSSREWIGAFAEFLRCEVAAPKGGAWPNLVLSAALGPGFTWAQAPRFTPEQDAVACEGLFTRLNCFLGGAVHSPTADHGFTGSADSLSDDDDVPGGR